MIKAILSHFRYWPHARKTWGQAGVLLIVGNPPWTGAQRGVEKNETGIAIRRFQTRYYPQINERLEDNAGECIARAVSDRFSRDITVEGEITGPGTGIMAFTLGTACTVANDVNDYGGAATVGRLLMDEGTITQERAGWRSVSCRLSSNPYLL
jgi:hypothetical protein